MLRECAAHEWCSAVEAARGRARALRARGRLCLRRPPRAVRPGGCGTAARHAANEPERTLAGPMGNYVNPGGYVHETLTVHKAKGLRLV